MQAEIVFAIEVKLHFFHLTLKIYTFVKFTNNIFFNNKFTDFKNMIYLKNLILFN